MAGNHDKSLDLLLQVYRNETRWSVFPKGAAVFTQEEESGFAQGSVEFLVEKALENGQPPKSQFYLEKYHAFFQTVKGEKKYQYLQGEVKKMGSAQCRSFSSRLTSTQFYFGKFVRSFCQVWNLKKPSLKNQARDLRNNLYKGVDLDDNSEGFPDGLAVRLREVLLTKLKASPWFDANGRRSLQLTLVGKYSYEHQTASKNLKHSYSVDIPYQEERIEKRPEPRQGSDLKNTLEVLEATSVLLSVLSGEKTSSSYTRDNGDGTVTVVETKHREEPRETTYSATTHEETFKLALALSGRFGLGQIDIVHNSSDRNTSLEHQNNMPEIGLLPQTARLIGEVPWLESKMDVLVKNFERKLIDAWGNMYCKDSIGEKPKPDTIEAMFRCVRVRTTRLPTSLNKWFESSLGLSYIETDKLVGGVF